MLSDLVDNVMDLFGGRKSHAHGDDRNGRSGPRGMIDSLLEGEDPRQDRNRHRDAEWDDDEPFDAERRGRHGDRRSSFPDFD